MTVPEGPASGVGFDVAVVGSIHRDLVLNVAALPRPGETTIARGHFRAAGGKGANQAVAARRLGARVGMVGQVGDDADGSALRAALDTEGLDVDGVAVHPTLPSGLAVVVVDEDGENQIVVSSGASGAIDLDHLDRCAAMLRDSHVTLLQLEVAIEVVERAAALATGVVVLNPAPAAELPPGLLADVDVLVPNRLELARIVASEGPLRSLEDVERAAKRVSEGCAVVVTLGADGALVVEEGEVVHVPAPSVETIDATGAGDTLCGALAVRLAAGDGVVEAVPWAVRAAALSTTRAGAQPSLPTLDELERFAG